MLGQRTLRVWRGGHEGERIRGEGEERYAEAGW
jgi:hypothetical protein